MALERKQNSDYSDAVNLLCRLAQCGGADAKRKVRERLNPKGQTLYWVLLQVAEIFDVELANTELLAKDAETVAQNIRLQVRRVPSDCAIKPIPHSYFHKTVDLGNEKLYVHVVDAVDVEAIIRHRHKLAEETLRPLIEAIVAMICEWENVISTLPSEVIDVRSECV